MAGENLNKDLVIRQRSRFSFHPPVLRLVATECRGASLQNAQLQNSRVGLRSHLRRGMQPIAVSHLAPTVHTAIDGALERLERALEKKFGRLNDLKGRVEVEED
jgi:ribosome-associated translation inhibitor RaiA